MLEPKEDIQKEYEQTSRSKSSMAVSKINTKRNFVRVNDLNKKEIQQQQRKENDIIIK